MSKKHFIELADMFRVPSEFKRSISAALEHCPELKQADIDDLTGEILHNLADDVARFCKSQNVNFNRERWLAYIKGECGPNGGAIKRVA